MIKCDGFGKLLKPLFSILSIGFFGLLGNSFVNGVGAYQPVGFNLSSSAVNSGYSVAFHNGGGVFTSFLGQGKSVLALDKDRVFWWTPNGFPYVYLRSDNRAPTIQGFFDRYYTCDEFGSNNNLSISNCSLVDYIDYSGDNQYIKNQFKSFFSTINSGDYGYYGYTNNQYIGATYDFRNNYIRVCFSSHSIGQSICFMGGYCYNEGECNGNLINSQGIQDLSYGMISPSWVGYAPGQVGYDGEYYGDTQGSLNVNSSSVITGDYTYSTCTVGQVINELESNGYTPYVCYGGLDNFNDWDSSQTYNVIPGSGLRLSQILSYSSVWSTPQEWFDYWAGLYGDDKFNAMWESYPAVYHTWFDLYYRYTPNKYFDYVREYCNMKVDLNLDLNSVYKGQYFKGVCDTIIDKQIYNYGNTTSGGEVLQGVNWGFNSGQSINNSIEFIQNYFNLLKSKINLDYSPLNVGFLPKYIIGFLLALILFRFISH